MSAYCYWTNKWCTYSTYPTLRWINSIVSQYSTIFGLVHRMQESFAWPQKKFSGLNDYGEKSVTFNKGKNMRSSLAENFSKTNLHAEIYLQPQLCLRVYKCLRERSINKISWLLLQQFPVEISRPTDLYGDKTLYNAIVVQCNRLRYNVPNNRVHGRAFRNFFTAQPDNYSHSSAISLLLSQRSRLFLEPNWRSYCNCLFPGQFFLFFLLR